MGARSALAAAQLAAAMEKGGKAMRTRYLLWTSSLLAALCGGCGGGDGGGIPVTLNLQADVRTPSQINLSWTPHPGPVSGYQVQRNGAPAFPTLLQGTIVSDFNLEPDTQYCYIVVAMAFPFGPMGQSNQVCVRTSTTAQWRLETIDAATAVWQGSLGIDAANGLHVGYRRSDGVAYATNTSGQWAGTLIDGTAGASGDTSIAMGTTGAVHVSYKHSSSGALKHATNASGSWVISTIDAIGFGSSIKVDSANRIHVSYRASPPSGGFLAYAVNVNGSWTREFVTGWGGSAIHTALAIDATGAAHIAYADGSGICAVGYTTNASGTWVGTVLTTNSQQCRAAIVLDALGRAHVVYMQGFDLMYATNASGAWVTMSVDRLDWIGFPDVSIAMDLSGALHVSYQDHNADLKYATNRSGSWLTSYVDARGSVGAGNAVKVDSNGAVHITYFDASNAKLKHATDR